MSKQNRAKNTAAKKKAYDKPATPWMWIGIASGVILVAVIVLFAYTRNKAGAPLNEISAVLAYEKFQQGVFFLDVRTQDEWNEGHIAKSTLIPLDELATRVGELPKNQPILVVCRSGNRSKQGMRILQEAGFTQVMGLEGGLKAWSAAGYPLEP